MTISSGRSRVQRPEPLDLAAIQDVGGSKRPFRVSPNTIRSDHGSIHENVSDFSDTERFARMVALMAMLGDEINDYGSAIHSELQRQIDDRRYQDISDTIDNHLVSFKWNTPPISPLWTDSSASTTPSSASSATERNRFIARDLRNKEFLFLLDKDKAFHVLMRDLNGLREWWSVNRAKWRERRNMIYDIDRVLNDLAFRMDNVDEQESIDYSGSLIRRCSTSGSSSIGFPRTSACRRR
jgi:hypothetical protein